MSTIRKAPNRPAAFQLLPTQFREWPFEFRAILLVLVLAILPGMFFAPNLFGLVAGGTCVWLVWLARAESLPLLFLLYLAPTDFFGSSELLRGGIVETDANLQMLKLLTLAVASIRVVWEGLARRDLLLFRGGLRGFYAIWLLVIPLAFVSSYLGYISGFENWTRSVRFHVTAGMFFYGIIVVRRSSLRIDTIRTFFEAITLVLLLLAFFHSFWQHIVFLLIGFGGAMGIDAIAHGRIFRRINGGLIFCLAGWLAVNGTFTMRGIFILSAALMVSLFSNSATGRLARTAALVAILFVPSIVGIAIGYGSGYWLSSENTSAIADSSFSENLLMKIAGDRGPIWFESFEQICSGPYLVRASGKPIMLLNLSLSTEREWDVGSHNALLELTRNGGLVLGVISITFIFWQFFRLRAALPELRGTSLIGVATAIFSVAVIGTATGDFPLDHNVGFWIWCLCGCCVEFSRRHNNRPSMIAD